MQTRTYLFALFAMLAGCGSTVAAITDAAPESAVDAPIDVIADAAPDSVAPDTVRVDAVTVDTIAVDASMTDAVTVDAVMTDAPRTDAPRTCTSQSQCAASEECQGGAGCAVPWVCGPRLGRACTMDMADFCGCDGSSFAASSTCPDRPYQHMGRCSMAMVTCTLPSGARCPEGMTCPLGDGCNDCTCVSVGMLMCTARPCAFDAGPPRPTCYSNLDCRTGEECAGPPGCATPWACRAVTDRICMTDAVPYCGCDGRTFYGSSTCAPRPYASTGACGLDGG